MLTVTDKAARYLREALSRKEEGTPQAIRIVHTEEGYRLTMDDPKDSDQVFEQEGQNYLLVPAKLGEALSDATLDVQESPQGASLTLTAAHNPEPEPTPGAEAGAEAEAEAKPEAKPQSEPSSPSQ